MSPSLVDNLLCRGEAIAYEKPNAYQRNPVEFPVSLIKPSASGKHVQSKKNPHYQTYPHCRDSITKGVREAMSIVVASISGKLLA